ncbi:hypothetical protein HNS38_09245 [Lentimicrobium sp. L6]|uniref:alginate O-acetyltransferase AlgX-related protein n=1 Tax=Lentimicrobium sp. L6 TaxID=2735916 RepID=UPI0015575E89|nr:hypothetical protein [Lentimicrobium sp. L6]NPD84942.1 hypothetical protein [Lentimicrobium sp. L6]
MMKLAVNISFLVLLFAFSLNHLFHIVHKEDTSENRKLAEKPKLDINQLDPYPNAYNDYFNDHFAGRNYLIDIYEWLNNSVYQKKTSRGKYIRGNDNYVFETSKNLPVYTGKKTISNEQLERMALEFQKRKEYFNNNGMEMYILIIPSKYKVLSEKLPMLIRKGSQNMGDRFIEYFKANTNIAVIDGLPILKEKGKIDPVFLKYDTHWNQLGAFYVYQELVQSIYADMGISQSMDTSLFTFESYDKEGGNMKNAAVDQSDFDFGYRISPKNMTFKKDSGYRHHDPDFRYGDFEFCRRFKSSNSDFPKAIIFRDSFGNTSLSFLPEVFSETVYIWDDWQYKFNKEIIDIEKPDVVIYSIYETYIDRLLQEPSFVEPDIEQDKEDVQ